MRKRLLGAMLVLDVAAVGLFAVYAERREAPAPMEPSPSPAPNASALARADTPYETMRNTGDQAAAGQCTITAYDASRAVGFDIFTSDTVEPGGTTRGTGAIRIEDEGAFRVQRVEASSCEGD